MTEFDDLPSLRALRDELGRMALDQGRPRSVRSGRIGSRTLALAVAGLLLGSGTAAGTLLALRGAVIPGPAPIDAGPSQVPAAGTSHVTPLRSPDPGGGLDWALRVSRSKTGLVCSTVAQVQNGQFGIKGLDGKFRAVQNGAVDGCGQQRANATSLLGARVFDADRRAQVRTVINGVAGDTLAAVTVRAGQNLRRPSVGPGGTYLLALRGYPEDLGLTVTLRFQDGHQERHPLGTDDFVVTDPLGGPAWKAESFMFGGDARLCVSFRPARERGHNPAISPSACGHPAERGSGTGRQQTGVFFAIRRLEPDNCTLSGHPLVVGRWCGHPPRTAVWGFAGHDVQSISVLGSGLTHRLTISPNRSILDVLAPSVNPAQLRVQVTFEDGQTRTFRQDTNLVPPPETR